MDGLLIALIILVVYIIIIYVLKVRGTLEKYNITLWGPVLMWRTQRGKGLIDRLAKYKRLWSSYAFLAKIICAGAMIAIMALLIWEATLVPSIPASDAPSPQLILGIPGINPIIPIWYGILGLLVAIVCHEFGHGILTRVNQMKLKALGVLLLVVPIGAFVEPDEEELTKTEKKRRTSVYAVGPATNIIIALVCALIFSSVLVASAVPVRDGPVIVSVAGGSPASQAGLQFGAQIIDVNGSAISNDGYSNITAVPGTPVNVTYYYGGEQKETTVIAGLVVTSVISGLPADQAGLRSGMIISSINGTEVTSQYGFLSLISQLAIGKTVNITALVYEPTQNKYVVDSSVTDLTPVSKKAYYEKNYPGTVGPSFHDMAFLGVTSGYFGAGASDPNNIVDQLAHPFKGANSFGGFVQDGLYFIALPFFGLEPIQSPMSELFHPGGVFAGLSNGEFWIISNCFYWIFWLNLMVGLTNSLPTFALDGGVLFRDWMDGLVLKIKKGSNRKRKRAVCGHDHNGLRPVSDIPNSMAVDRP